MTGSQGTTESPRSTDSSCEADQASRLRALTIRIFGDPTAVDIDRRILNGIMFLVFLTGILATASNIAIGASGHMLLSTGLATVIALLGYWAVSRTRVWRALLVPMYLFFLALLAYSWITQAGTNGTIGYYFFLLVCYLVVLLHGRTRTVMLFLTATTLAALLLVELLSPATIIPYATERQRFADLAIALPLCLSTTGIFVLLVYREYRRERNAKDDLLRLVTSENEQVVRSMRDKQRLLTVVGHDIANVLTVLQGEIALAQKPTGAEPAPGREALERMRFACDNINEIISSVRMMEAVEQGHLVLGLEPVDLQTVFKNAELIFGDRLAQRRTRIDFPQLGQDTRFVMAEPRILANQVFSNLISNAIKFSYPDSTIAVAVSRQGNETTLSITDHGIGMPPDLLAKLFDLNAKTTRPGTEGEPGTGFGLRTVKYFVELFGGSLDVVSRSESAHPTDHGTTVSVHLASGQPLAERASR